MTPTGRRVAQWLYVPTHACAVPGTSDHETAARAHHLAGAPRPHPHLTLPCAPAPVTSVNKSGDFTVTLAHEPRYVDAGRCTSCGLCEAICPVSVPNEFQSGLSLRKAIFKMAPRVTPNAYSVDRACCAPGCTRCATVCPTDAINLSKKPLGNNPRRRIIMARQ
jgi:heterodisulfide reductase subunit A-like polyferredoxin